MIVPRSGDRYVMPEGQGEYLVVKSHEETGGEYVEMEWTLPPGAFAPPPHRHPSQVEEYEVLDGSFEVMVDGDWRKLGPGDKASVPIGVNHTFRTLPGETLRVRNFHRPGARFDEFVEKQHRFVNSERYKGLKHPSTAVVMAMAWREHRDLLVPTNPLLRGAMAGLERLGKMLGYRI
ncbi:MAG TPA: cupin domain-containing protein [Thermoleophilaceae bacterium]|nr:cupin domain-containing protein [Thermoleophilaceae bacterium]